MKKEILHVVECFSGGVYDFIVSLVNGLPEFNHTILYAKRENFKENFKDDFSEKIKFIHWKNASREISLKKDFLAGKELYNILSEKKYNNIHLHSSKAGFIGRVVGRIKNQQNKVLYTTHGVSFLRKDVSNFKNRLYILFEKIGMYMGGEILACSKSEAEFMRNKGIKRANYIFNGIEIPRELPKIKKNKNIINIVTVGRITTPKNPKQFNEIAEQFLDNKKIKFTWIGDGELRDELKSSNINITGWKNQHEVLEELCKGDIYLSTSLWEGLPLSVLQAMSVELPLVLSDCIGNIDLIDEEKNGYIFQEINGAVNNIKKLITYNLVEKGEHSKRKVKKLEISIMTNKYRKKYIL
ncbi:glycosyltransferase [Cetobacterium sp.]|uniref:glycosyltransferase n=1 Tax=Cetobacterium sp. TaxID=2071632 RepID=UPI002FCC245F